MLVAPLMNGRMPRIEGGFIDAILVDPSLVRTLPEYGVGTPLLLTPFIAETGTLYPAGIVCEVKDLWVEDIYVKAPSVVRTHGLFCQLSGRSYARAKGFRVKAGLILAESLEPLDLAAMRSSYPAISGAGWTPIGGFTEARRPEDIRITVEGVDNTTGGGLSIDAQVGRLLSEEQAHTVEHALIRALTTYLLVTPKTLYDSLQREAEELKRSIDLGMALELPEIFGVTQSGACGNPLTHLARVYLWDELLERIKEGQSPLESLTGARRKTLSKLTQELEINTEAGIRTLQTLKKGMKHQDTPIPPGQLAEVIKRFPMSPWH